MDVLLDEQDSYPVVSSAADRLEKTLHDERAETERQLVGEFVPTQPPRPTSGVQCAEEGVEVERGPGVGGAHNGHGLVPSGWSAAFIGR